MPLGGILFNDATRVWFMYVVVTRMPGERYRRRRMSLLLRQCDVFRTLIISLVFCFSYYRIV